MSLILSISSESSESLFFPTSLVLDYKPLYTRKMQIVHWHPMQREGYKNVTWWNNYNTCLFLSLCSCFVANCVCGVQSPTLSSISNMFLNSLSGYIDNLKPISRLEWVIHDGLCRTQQLNHFYKKYFRMYRLFIWLTWEQYATWCSLQHMEERYFLASGWSHLKMHGRLNYFVLGNMHMYFLLANDHYIYMYMCDKYSGKEAPLCNMENT